MRPKHLAVLLAAAFPSLFLSTRTSAQNAGVSNGHGTPRGHAPVLAPGTVSSTANPQVALYSLTLPLPGSWSVSFGLTTAYGHTTSVQTVDGAGKTASMYVAGMLPNTTYHMQATVTLKDRTVATDSDHTFNTGPLPPGIPASFPVTLGVTGTPQPGIELLDSLQTVGSVPSTVVATDLQGNVIWTYPFPDRTNGTWLFPAKLMPDGNFIGFLSPNSYPLDLPGSEIMREFDLAGNTVRQLSMADLNTALAAANFPVTLSHFTHDVTALPNGHFLLITNTSQSFTDLPGYPGTTQVVGDVIIDLDPNWNPVWIWNEFDHLDVNRHPMSFPDWTHSNSIAYSADDGNFLVSIRHQNWVVKVDYRDGQGTGNILWKLGEGGDFTLQGGVDPTDWFYAQHYAEFATTNTTGVFTLGIMDNGDDREFPAGVTCGAGNDPPCQYSTIQRLQIDETHRTATFLFHQILPSYLYSSWGGSTDNLPNGDVEYDLSDEGPESQVFEVTNESTPRMVWNMTTLGANEYRGYRMPSLYPGVQW